MKPLSAVLFDLDGTLIDSIELILRSLEHTLEAYGKPPRHREQLTSRIGIPLRTHLAVFGDDDAEIDAMVDTYRAWNRAHHDAFVQPMDGIGGALDALAERGLRTAVVTSKLRPDAERGLALCGLAGRFEFVTSPEDTERHKPEPEPLLHACQRLGVSPLEAAYVGDSVHDMKAAVAAGTRAVGAGWGPFAPDALQRAGANPLLAHPAELARID